MNIVKVMIFMSIFTLVACGDVDIDHVNYQKVQILEVRTSPFHATYRNLNTGRVGYASSKRCSYYTKLRVGGVYRADVNGHDCDFAKSATPISTPMSVGKYAPKPVSKPKPSPKTATPPTTTTNKSAIALAPPTTTKPVPVADSKPKPVVNLSKPTSKPVTTSKPNGSKTYKSKR